MLAAGSAPSAAPWSMHVHLCAVTGGAKPVVAPLRPACKEAGGLLRHFSCFGPIAILCKKRPAGRSGTERPHKIGYDALLLRLIIRTRLCVGPATVEVQGHILRFPAAYARASSAARGCAAICLPRHL